MKNRKHKAKWLVTGVAGFIGSNIADKLLKDGYEVIGVDNFSTGTVENVERLRAIALQHSAVFQFHECDIRDYDKIEFICRGVDYVCHQAALGSVPRSLENPLLVHDVNVNGFINVLNAAKVNEVKRMVYASSSSVYGDEMMSPKIEDRIGNALSPYATTKHINELYASIFSRSYSMELVGLRYFNIFGPYQNPNGAYAAVIPKWMKAASENNAVKIFGDGLTSRDFCYIDNCVNANILACTTPDIKHSVYNVAVGDNTSLNQVASAIIAGMNSSSEIVYEPFRAGDIRHSQANCERLKTDFGLMQPIKFSVGLQKTIDWYLDNAS